MPYVGKEMREINKWRGSYSLNNKYVHIWVKTTHKKRKEKHTRNTNSRRTVVFERQIYLLSESGGP